MNRVSTNNKHSKMDSRLRGNDKVGGSASRLAKSAGSEEKHTLSLSFPRRRESTEKASKSGSDEFLEVPLRGNDKMGRSASRLAKSAGSEEKHTLSLSFLRNSGPPKSICAKHKTFWGEKQESIKKSEKRDVADFLEGHFRKNDDVGTKSCIVTVPLNPRKRR